MSFAPEPLCYEAAATPRALFKCPLGHHRCMTEISSEQVYRVCMELVRE